MNVSPIVTAHACPLVGSYLRHESDLLYEARAVKASLDNSLLIGKTMDNRAHHMQEVASKMVMDSLYRDPFWINNVNYVASYSRHNYINMCKII